MNIFEAIGHILGGLIDKLGDWIQPELDAAAILYNKLEEIEKQSASYAYGVIAIINKNLGKDFSLIQPLIQQVYPSLSLDVLHGFFDTVLKNIKIVDAAVPLTLNEAGNQVATYLKSLEGSTWGQMSQLFGNSLAILFSPDTPVQKFSRIAELVYQVEIKPLLAKLNL
jgi:hypothetical protein